MHRASGAVAHACMQSAERSLAHSRVSSSGVDGLRRQHGIAYVVVRSVGNLQQGPPTLVIRAATLGLTRVTRVFWKAWLIELDG